MKAPFLFVLLMSFWAHEGIKAATYAITLDLPHFFDSALYMLMYAYFVQRFMVRNNDQV